MGAAVPGRRTARAAGAGAARPPGAGVAGMNRRHHPHHGTHRPQRWRAGWSRRGIAALVLLLLGLWLSGMALWAWGGEWSPDTPPWQSQAHRAAQVLHGVLVWAVCALAGRWLGPHAMQMWGRKGARVAWWLGLATAALGGWVALAGLGLLWPLLALGHGLYHRWLGR